MVFCTALEVALERATGTFVDVLWCRFQGKDDEALNILNKVQLDASVCSMFFSSIYL